MCEKRCGLCRSTCRRYASTGAFIDETPNAGKEMVGDDGLNRLGSDRNSTSIAPKSRIEPSCDSAQVTSVGHDSSHPTPFTTHDSSRVVLESVTVHSLAVLQRCTVSAAKVNHE